MGTTGCRAHGRAVPRTQWTALHGDHRPSPLRLRSSRLSKYRDGCPDSIGLRSPCPARLAPDLASHRNVLSCPRKGLGGGIAAAGTCRILPGATGALLMTDPVPRSAPGFSSVVKPRPHGSSNPDPASRLRLHVPYYQFRSVPGSCSVEPNLKPVGDAGARPRSRSGGDFLGCLIPFRPSSCLSVLCAPSAPTSSTTPEMWPPSTAATPSTCSGE